MKILCIGDSNTYGYDPRSYVGSRYPAEIRWTDHLDGHVVVNKGVNGMTIPAAYTAVTATIKREDPDLVIVMLGTNDILMGNDSYETADRMDDFISSVKNTARRILLIAPPLLQLGEWVPGEALIEESRCLGDLYKQIATDYDIMFADAGKWDIDMTFDGVHFSPAGHEAFACRIKEVLEKAEGDQA